MLIYHVTTFLAGTEILISRKLKANTNSKVFFCLTFSDAERLIEWWRDIGFKSECEILALDVKELPYYPDPATTGFGGFYTTQDIIICQP